MKEITIPTCAAEDCDTLASTMVPVHVTGLIVTKVTSGKSDKNIYLCAQHRNDIFAGDPITLTDNNKKEEDIHMPDYIHYVLNDEAHSVSPGADNGPDFFDKVVIGWIKDNWHGNTAELWHIVTLMDGAMLCNLNHEDWDNPPWCDKAEIHASELLTTPHMCQDCIDKTNNKENEMPEKIIVTETRPESLTEALRQQQEHPELFGIIKGDALVMDMDDTNSIDIIRHTTNNKESNMPEYTTVCNVKRCTNDGVWTITYGVSKTVCDDHFRMMNDEDFANIKWEFKNTDNKEEGIMTNVYGQIVDGTCNALGVKHLKPCKNGATQTRLISDFNNIGAEFCGQHAKMYDEGKLPHWRIVVKDIYGPVDEVKLTPEEVDEIEGGHEEKDYQDICGKYENPVKCGNVKVHGRSFDVYHDGADQVKACFMGETVAPCKPRTNPNVKVSRTDTFKADMMEKAHFGPAKAIKNPYAKR